MLHKKTFFDLRRDTLDHMLTALRRPQNAINMKHLLPLRKASGVDASGEASDGASGPIKQDELNALDSEWMKWRKEWVSRKKTYQAYVDYLSSLVEKIATYAH